MNKVMDKIEKGREYRDMELTIRVDDDIEDEPNEQEPNEEQPNDERPDDKPERDERMIVEGYATTFDEEYELYWLDDKTKVMEVVDANAFDNCDMSDVIFQYDHEGRVFARLSNDTMELSVDEHGLKVIADLGGTEIGRNLFDEIAKGYTTKMSFGFIVSDDEIEEREESDDITVYVRKITGISKLFDVSAVSLPANNYTSISARKHCDGLIASYRAECAKRENEMKARELKIKQLRTRINLMKGVLK